MMYNFTYQTLLKIKITIILLVIVLIQNTSAQTLMQADFSVKRNTCTKQNIKKNNGGSITFNEDKTIHLESFWIGDYTIVADRLYMNKYVQYKAVTWGLGDDIIITIYQDKKYISISFIETENPESVRCENINLHFHSQIKIPYKKSKEIKKKVINPF